MEDYKLRQSNRLTTARYELNLIEKRVMYFIIKEVRKRYVLGDSGQKDLFDDLTLKIKLTDLAKEIIDDKHVSEAKKGLVSLRLRSFEYQNEHAGDLELDEWLIVGFINYAEIKKGVAEVQVSKKLIPYLVELTQQYTEYSLTVAMSLRSKWSQRIYEICSQWRSAGGFRISIKDLREQFMLEAKYSEYAALKERVLQIAHKELKTLYDAGQCDLYFEYSEEKKGRSVESLRFKVISREGLNAPNNIDLLRQILIILQELFEVTKKKKNADYIAKVISKLQKSPDLIPHAHKRITEILSSGISEPTRLIRFVLYEDILKDVEKPVKQEKVAKNEEKGGGVSVMDQISNLANNKTV